MIIRKPYAFLIKHFRRIHVFMLALCIFIYYKSMQTRSFVTEFLELESYDPYYEPITKYASVFALIVLLVLIALSCVFVVLLWHKKKPWKLYLIPLVGYAFVFITFCLTITLFSGYDEASGTTGIRAINDLLFMGTIPQYIVILILIMRILGLDLNKFDFKSDQEFLELTSDDREEIEISINFDKNSIKRLFRRLKRNIGYVYSEHKFVINSIVTVFVIVCVISIYRFVFIINKSYTQGDTISTNGYSIVLHHSYFTDKDYHGDVVSKDSDFVILDLTITNNASSRDVNFNRFHVMNGRNNYTQTYRTYSNDFQDLGTTLEKLTLNNGQSKRFIMIFKVDKDLDSNKFVLYYQEIENNKPHLRKIKLKVDNLTKIEKQKTKVLREEEILQLNSEEEASFSIEDYTFVTSTTYSTLACLKNHDCYKVDNPLSAKNGNVILQLFFTSDTFTGEEFVDFSMEYGKINYIDSKGENKSINVVDAVDKHYNGNYMYFDVPGDLQQASEIRLVYTIRNRKYVYRLK